MSASEEEQFFEISAVSRLTGVTTPNIRMWEKRHGVVEPKRSESKRRLYTPDDIQRLTLLKALVDRGHSIGTIATLSMPQLEQRLAAQERADGPKSVNDEEGSCCRLLVIGETLCEQFSGSSNFIEGTQVVASFGTLEEAGESPASNVDVVVIECSTLFEDTIPVIQELVRRSHAVRAVIVYRFTQQATVNAIEEGMNRITALRGPVNAEELQVVLRADVSMASRKYSTSSSVEMRDQEVPTRLFTDKELAKASQVSSTIDCECPQHLGNLITSLTAFEKYSNECESRSPDDEALHRFLHQTTAQARALMEHALQEVIDAEGIDL
jgi:DNA-binding transcriptional MerR regulator